MAANKKPSKTSTPKMVQNKSGKFPAPRTLKGGKKVTDNVSSSPWKSIDPVIPIIQVDWKRPGEDNQAKNKYGKGRKANQKKNGDWF